MQEEWADGFKRTEENGMVVIDLTSEQVKAKKLADERVARMNAAKAAKREEQNQKTVSKGKDKTGRKSRTRNFATVVYPSKEYLDSVGSVYDGADGYGTPPEDWMQIIADIHAPALVSPLHQDIKPDGTMKKPHFHVLFMFESVKDYESQVKPLFDSFGGVGREIVNSARGYARYLCHLDDHDNKIKYSVEDVLSFGGVDYRAIIHLPTDDIGILKEIFEFVRINQIYSIAELISISAVNNPDWFSVIVMSRGYIIDKYIKSLEWEEKSGYVRFCDRVK